MPTNPIKSSDDSNFEDLLRFSECFLPCMCLPLAAKGTETSAELVYQRCCWQPSGLGFSFSSYVRLFFELSLKQIAEVSAAKAINWKLEAR